MATTPRHKKMYKDSPRITADESGKKVVKKGPSETEKKSAEAASGTEGVVAPASGTDGIAAPASELAHKHAKESLELYHKHIGEHLDLAQKAITTGGTTEKDKEEGA